MDSLLGFSTKIEKARDETFAPILYVFEYDDLGEAMYHHNSVDQGLSSAVFCYTRLIQASGSVVAVAVAAATPRMQEIEKATGARPVIRSAVSWLAAGELCMP